MEATKSYREMTVEELINTITNDGTGRAGRAVSYKTCESVSYLSMFNDVELQELEGIGKTRARQIKAALELSSRLKMERRKPCIIKSANDVRELLQREEYDENIEHLWVIFLRNNNSVIRSKMMATGGISGVYIDIRLILREALSCYAAAIMLAHNHPSGNARPSAEDRHLTDEVNRAAGYMSIRLLDHVILTSNEESYYSFNEMGDL